MTTTTYKQRAGKRTIAVGTLSKERYSAEVEVVNSLGVHARPASMLCTVAKKYDCESYLQKKGRKEDPVSAKSLMGIFSLELGRRDYAIISTVEHDSNDAEQCLEEIVDLFKSGFGED